MKLHLLRLFLKEYGKRRHKTALITFAIFWGTLSILMLMSFGRGLTEAARVSFKGLGDNLVIVFRGQTSLEFQGLAKGRRVMLHFEDIGLLKRMIPEIRRISPETTNTHTVSYLGKEINRNVNGVYPDFGVMRSQFPEAGGRFLDDEDIAGSRRVAFLGWTVARDLFGAENPVGRTIQIQRMPFTVVGVMKKKQQSSNYQGMDYETIYIPYSTFALIDSQLFLDTIVIQPATEADGAGVERRIKRILGRKYRFAENDEYALNIWNAVEDMASGRRIFRGIEIFLTLIGALTLLIGAVGVTNLMYAVVKERTREIGIKMALGAKRRHVVLQFFLETGMIFVKGTAIGVLVAFNIVQLVRLVPLGYEDFGIQSYLLRPIFSADILLIFLLIMGVLVFVSGVFPAVRASRQNPIDALRYE
jgi:putative ABC transport system permease protein